MNYLKGYRTNPQVRLLHNVKAVQSRQGWTRTEVDKAMADARAGIAYEFCESALISGLNVGLLRSALLLGQHPIFMQQNTFPGIRQTSRCLLALLLRACIRFD